MIQFRFPPEIIRITYSFLTDRKFFVELNGITSSIRRILAGVPQGSVLGPFLFSIFTADQPLTNNRSSTLLYADDSITYSTAANPNFALLSVKRRLIELIKYYSKWGFKINFGKTEFILFRKPISNSRTSKIASACKKASLILNGHEIRPKDSIKYLGVSFHKLFKFRTHAESTIKKANAAYGFISSLVKRKNGLSSKVKVVLYKQLIRPILSYAFPIWFTINKTTMNKLLKLERRILRACTAKYFKRRYRYYSNKELYETAMNVGRIQPLDVHLTNHAEAILRKVRNHSNSIISSLATDNRNMDAANEYWSPFAIINEELSHRFKHDSPFNFYRTCSHSDTMYRG